jgi:hypothetical protein
METTVSQTTFQAAAALRALPRNLCSKSLAKQTAAQLLKIGFLLPSTATG